ncbi:MAG: tetratricopeptide repeat protein [Candidatus Eisenbacteria bacterium]|nr:tetratricopeptide repeat protein [Candidatus Eisenbacteria bacterium]
MRKGSVVALFFTALLLVSIAAQAGGQSDVARTPDALSGQSLSALKELRLNSGITSLSSYAHAYYKIGVEKRRAGDSRSAVQAFKAAIELDPYFPDPHFSLFRAYLFHDPVRALAELSAVVRIVREDFFAQYMLLKNAAFMGYLTLFIALALFTVFASVRHIARLKHAISERLASEMTSSSAGWLGLFVLLQPIIWSLGVTGTILCYSASLWKCMNRRERFFGLLFLAIAAATPFLSREMPAKFPPLGDQSPTYVSYEALRNGWSPELENALVRYTESDSQNPFVRFAYGTVARRAGKLGIARAELEAAVRLSPNDAASLNNLANVYFNLSNLAAAEDLYRRAMAADPSLAQPHYNLGQVFTKKLMFAEANEQFKTANETNPRLTNGFSLNSREQLNRSVIDMDPVASTFWKSLLQERTQERASASPFVLSPALLRLLGIGTGRRIAAILLFFALSMIGGLLAFRNLYTYSCSNCGRIVCRKCLTRVHRKLFCLKCGAAASALKSEEFTQLLLNNQLRLEARRTKSTSLFLGIVVPGFRLVQKGDTVKGFLFLLLSSFGAVYLYGAGYLIDVVPSLRYQQEHLLKYVLVIVPLALLHALALFRLSRKAEPQPVLLTLVKTQPAKTMVKDGTTGKP